MWLDVAAGGSKWQALGQHGIMPSVSAEPPRIGSGLVAKPGLGSICLSACDDLSGSTRSILAFLLALLLSPRNTRAQRLTPPPRRSWAPFSISFSWGIISPPSPTTPAKLLHMVRQYSMAETLKRARRRKTEGLYKVKPSSQICHASMPVIWFIFLSSSAIFSLVPAQMTQQTPSVQHILVAYGCAPSQAPPTKRHCTSMSPSVIITQCTYRREEPFPLHYKSSCQFFCFLPTNHQADLSVKCEKPFFPSLRVPSGS